MNIVTQLKHLESAFSADPGNLAPSPGLNTEDSDTLKKVFSLGPPAFVDAWAGALALTDKDFTPADRDTFISAIQSGTSRLKVIDALYARRWVGRPALTRGFSPNVFRPQGQFVLIENLERIAPDDHAAFVRYAFSEICDREPTSTELLTFDFDLRRGAVARRALIKKIVRIANQEGHPALWDSLDLEEDKSDPTCARTLPTGFAYDEQGRQSLIFVRQLPEGGWLVAPDVMRQSPKIEERGWLVEDGWILTGPKRSLSAGCWRVDLDILQQEHLLDVDVVANSGLDILQHITLCGNFHGSFCITIASHHRFVELRVLARGGAIPVWINPRNISMHRVS